MTWKSIAGVLLLSGMAILSGCGGSGGDSEPASTTAVVAFSAISSEQLPARIGGIKIAVVLPPGVSVPTDSADPKQISSTALVAGSALDAQTSKAIMGSYSSAGRLVTIAVTGAPGFGPGEYARLTCVVAPGATVTKSGIAALNTPLATFTVLDVDTLDITNYLTPDFSLK